MGRLSNKNILITGGSSGIGAAIVRAFSQEGASICFSYKSRRDDSLLLQKKMEEEHGKKCLPIQCDLERQADIEKLFETAKSELQYIDVLVNNAGGVRPTKFLDTTPEQLRTTLDLNFFAPFILCQLFCRDVIARGSTGRILNISSLSAIRSASKLADYQSSKAALAMLSKSIAFELAPYGISSNTISPGLTQTAANKAQWGENTDRWMDRVGLIPLGRAGMPEDHVGAAVFLASDEAGWVTGADLVIDGGQSTR